MQPTRPVCQSQALQHCPHCSASLDCNPLGKRLGSNFLPPAIRCRHQAAALHSPVASKPLLSASWRGMTSSARAKAVMKSWLLPGMLCA